MICIVLGTPLGNRIAHCARTETAQSRMSIYDNKHRRLRKRELICFGGRNFEGGPLPRANRSGSNTGSAGLTATLVISPYRNV